MFRRIIYSRDSQTKDLIKYLGQLDKNASKIHEATGLRDKELVETKKICVPRKV